MRFWIFLGIFIVFSESAYADKIDVGYMPNLWFAQPFIIKGEGWDKKVGLDVQLHRFPGPPTQVQAFAAGQMDVIYNNIGSLLVLPDRGIAVRVVAASIKDDIFLAARPALMAYRETLPAADAIQAFVRDKGRRVKISTNPKGTLSDLVLRYWLESAFGADYDSCIEVVNTGSQDQFQHSILSGDVDAAAVFQPLYTVSRYKDPSLDIFLSPADMMTDQPGGVVAVRESFAAVHPDLVEKFVALHARATDLMRRDPERAARHIHAAIGDYIPYSVMETAVVFTRDRFVADPHAMISSTRIIQDLMLREKYLRKPVDISTLYDTSFFDRVMRHFYDTP
jgi:NitT/TauT family transport system substrate-binding protein